MWKQHVIEVLVGLFMILGLIAIAFLAFKVSGLADYTEKHDFYTITADFDNIGSLKVRAPVMVAGVWVGQVNQISLDNTNFRAKVTLMVDHEKTKLPTDTVASIYTQGLLGANYINLSPGYANTFIENGGAIETTNSAIVVEKLVGEFLYSFQNKK